MNFLLDCAAIGNLRGLLMFVEPEFSKELQWKP